MAEQISLRKLFNEGTTKGIHAEGIRIPNLQRDYAYGRTDSQTTEKRNEFLTKIFDFLCGNDEDYFYMDYVFGSIVEDGFFILVDGQQRLTTLFLLYYYFSIFDIDVSDKYKHIMDFNETMSKDEKSRLIYETRQSSKDFCNALVEKKNLKTLFDVIEAKQNRSDIKLSECIMDQKWFFYHWKNDNTVKGMLVFLDAIHDKFGLYACSGYYSKLDSFVFEAVDLNNTYSSENSGEYTVEKAGELYIKMNSRGKRLTRYENLKSNIGDYYDHTDFEDKIMPLLDVKCTDALWNYFKNFKTYVDSNNNSKNKGVQRTDFVDQGLLTIINLIIINEYALSSEERNISAQIVENDIKRWFGKEVIIPFTEYKELFGKRKDDNDKEFVYKLPSNLYNCINVLFEKDENDEVLQWLPEDFIYYNEKKIFNEILELANYEAMHLNRLKFYAYYLFLSKYYDDKVKVYNDKVEKAKAELEKIKAEIDETEIEKIKAEIDKAESEKTEAIDEFKRCYKDWMRLVCNLINNSFEVINSWGTYITAINSIKNICGFGLEECFEKMKDSKGFRETVFKEEKYKAIKIIRSRKEVDVEGWEDWEKTIEDAEKKLYPYFYGQVWFPLLFGNQNTEVFKNYVEIFYKLFIDDGSGKALVDDCKKDGEFVRALLSESTDLNYYYVKDKNNDECIYLYGNGQDNREFNWSRYFRYAELKNLEVLKIVIDKYIANRDFNKIISDNSEKLDGWRKLIIESPELFESIENPDKDVNSIGFFGKKRKILIKDPGIFSFNNPAKKQINARHKEFYSYKEYCRLCKNNEAGVIYIAGPNYNGAYVEKLGQKYLGVEWDDVKNEYVKVNVPW